MDRGLYAASSGGLQASRRLDVVANNLANVNTPGFKAERIRARQQQFEDTLASTLPQGQNHRGDFERVPGVVGDGTFTDFAPGPIESTGNPLNVALVPKDQFFVVLGANGEEFTRAGNFTINSENELVTPDGAKVSGGGSSITVPPGGSVRILDNGNIVVGPLKGSGQQVASSQVVGQLQVVKVSDLQQLERTQGTRFRLKGGGTTPVENPMVMPESLEMANVSHAAFSVQMVENALARRSDQTREQVYHQLTS